MPDFVDQIRRRNDKHPAAGMSQAISPHPAMTRPAQMPPTRTNNQQIIRPTSGPDEHRAGVPTNGPRIVIY
jgi:hypothetical protein